MMNWDEVKFELTQWRDKNTGALLREIFKDSHGRLDRGDLPSIVDYDPISGEVIRCAHHKEGLEHRIDAPAEYIIDPITKIVTVERWLTNGRFHRGNGLPAILDRDPQTGNITYREFWEDGKFLKKKTNKLKSAHPQPK